MRKLLSEITDESLGLERGVEKLGTDYRLRKSARVILFNQDGKMATQYLENRTHHKLPGGGVDPGETLDVAAIREVLEEVGCACEIISEVGMTIEYRNKYNLIHISYCFIATVVGEIGEPTLEAGEIEEGQVTKWVDPVELFELMKADKPKNYEGHFILEREKSFIKEYINSN
jgi:8-oxo-dGTP pyrophosphatase MutT (NUDIX family)